MHVSNPNNLEAAPVRTNNVVVSQSEDGSLSNFGPSLQVKKPTALAELADQVYDTVLYEEVCHSLAPRAPRFVEVHVQFPEENGSPEALQGLIQVRQVIQRLQGYVCANEWGPGESGDNLAA